MKRETKYPGKLFSRDALAALHLHLMKLWDDKKVKVYGACFYIGNDNWEVDSINELLTSFTRADYISLCISAENRTMWFYRRSHGSEMNVSSPIREEIQETFSVLEQHLSSAADVAADPELVPKIFLGHGRSPLWRELKDHLSDLYNLSVVAYEVGSRSGHAIRDVLNDMLEESSMALLLMTAEDELKDGEFQARANVIHETGLFQGKLGFSRAIVLVEEGTRLFSNLDGIQQVRFAKGSVRECFGDVLAAIRREFPAALIGTRQ